MLSKIILVAALISITGAESDRRDLYQQYNAIPKYDYDYSNVKYQPAHLEKPAQYSFNYGVHDDYSGNHYGHQETRDGYDTKGSYHVKLPDGRIQTVTYYVSGDSGFVAEVSYAGEIQHSGYNGKHQPQPKLYRPTQDTYHPKPKHYHHEPHYNPSKSEYHPKPTLYQPNRQYIVKPKVHHPQPTYQPKPYSPHVEHSQPLGYTKPNVHAAPHHQIVTTPYQNPKTYGRPLQIPNYAPEKPIGPIFRDQSLGSYKTNTDLHNIPPIHYSG